MTASLTNLPRIGVIGGGHLGRIHAKLLAASPECHLVGVVEPSPNAAEVVQNSLGLPVIEDYRSLLGKVDGVVIATPTFTHHEIGCWCLRNQIDVLMEKPIASTCEQAAELVGLARTHKRVLQVGHVERFNPAWREVVRNLDRNGIRYIEGTREGTYTGRSTDIGIVMDLMIHDIDLILSLVGSPLENIHAFGWSVLGEHEDFAVAHLRFRNGTIAQLKASRVSEKPTRGMNIFSDDGNTQIDFASGKLTTIEPQPEVACRDRQADTLPAEERFKVKDTLFEEWLCKTEHTPASTNAIVDEHREFIGGILGSGKITVSGQAGADALLVAHQIVQSILATSPERSIVPAADRFAA